MALSDYLTPIVSVSIFVIYFWLVGRFTFLVLSGRASVNWRRSFFAALVAGIACGVYFTSYFTYRTEVGLRYGFPLAWQTQDGDQITAVADVSESFILAVNAFLWLQVFLFPLSFFHTVKTHCRPD